MGKKRMSDHEVVTNIRKGSTPEVREMQIIAAAYDLAEQRIRDGTASDTLIRELIKLGSPKERIERDILDRQRDLITAKTEALRAQKSMDELYADAISAFKSYRGDNEEL